MEVNNKIVFKQVSGDQGNDRVNAASASPNTPSPEIRNVLQVAAGSGPDLWPESQQQTINKSNTSTLAVDPRNSKSQGQYDLSLMKLEFSKDQETGKIVVKIIDQNTDKVIRQVPPQEFLDIVHSMNKAAKELLKRLPKTI